MECARGIHRVEAPLGDRIVCLFLLVGEDRTLLVDTGIDETPRASLVPYLSELAIGPERIDYVLITHADLDHQGGNAALRELAPSATFLCHELDRPLIESTDRPPSRPRPSRPPRATPPRAPRARFS
jgi:glyoxylase-like metal-dependent hydrolase (beta-lactamase superfamily II)